MSSKDIIRLLKMNGFTLLRQNGSHQIWGHPDKGKVTVPYPKKDLPIGTARQILKQAGLKQI